MGSRRARARFQKTVFSNGLTLVTERQPGFRSLSIGIWVRAGTRHESSREAGMSHFLEHMLFKGTETRSALDIAREVDQVGGEFNAFTTREYTCFHVLLLGRDLDLGLDILSDVVLNSDFDPAELEVERKVILQEIAMVDESPEELAHDLFFEAVYGRHGLGKSILGSEASIRRMKRADMLRFFRKHYRPDQLVVSVSGDISHQAVKRRMASLGKKRWQGRPAASGRASKRAMGFSPAPPMRPGRWWINRPTEQTHLVWGVHGPSYSSRDRFAAYLLNTYLGGGMSSSLFQEIREKNGLAYTVYSTLSPFQDSGIFMIYAATGLNQVPLCLKLIEQCVQRLCRDLLPEPELEMVKSNIRGTVQLSADSVESRMSSLATNEIYFGRYVPVDEICEMIEKVTPQDLRRVARKLFGRGERSVLALGSKPSPRIRKAFFGGK